MIIIASGGRVWLLAALPSTPMPGPVLGTGDLGGWMNQMALPVGALSLVVKTAKETE